jgi:hypothetical protein
MHGSYKAVEVSATQNEVFYRTPLVVVKIHRIS